MAALEAVPSEKGLNDGVVASDDVVEHRAVGRSESLDASLPNIGGLDVSASGAESSAPGAESPATVEVAATADVGAPAVEEDGGVAAHCEVANSTRDEGNGTPVSSDEEEGSVAGTAASTERLGRPRRAAAVKAVALIAGHSAEDLRKVRASKKRLAAVADELEEQEEEDEPVDKIREVRCVTEREDREGARWYRIRWRNVSEGESEYSWVPEADLDGASAWKEVVDHYYDEALPKNPGLLFRHFMDQDMAVITMSSSSECTCVYTAVAKLMELQQASMQLTKELVTEFEAQEGFDRLAQRGLKAAQVEHLFRFLVKRGWKNQLHPSQYEGGVTGPVGLALAAKNPGLYFVGTIEPPRTSHCFVLEIKEDMSCFVHEGGIRIRLGQYQYAQQIRWVRKCSITGGRGSVSEGGFGESEIATEGVEDSSVPFAKRRRKAHRKRAKKAATVDLTTMETE